MEVKHSIDFGNGYIDVEEPSNFDSAEVDIIFTKDKARATMANLSLVWKGGTAAKIFKVYEQGKAGGKGISSALPYRITVCGTSLFLDLMLVLGHSSTVFACDEISVPAWAAQGADWLEMETDGYSFWHLYKNLQANDPGKINFSDFKKTPYLLNTIPNYTEVISLSFQALVLLWQLKTMGKTFIKDSANLTTTVSAAGVPITGTEHILIVISRIANLTLEGAQIVLYLILIAKFMVDLKANLIQDKKYKLGMRERDLFQKMCDFLKIPFSSSIYAPGAKLENATWMPEKIVMPKLGQNILDNLVHSLFDRPEDENFYPASSNKSFGYFDGLFSEFIATMERKYNAEFKIINGVGTFEGVNSWNTIGAYQIPNTGAMGYTFNLPSGFRTNLSQLAPYYECAFQIDSSEKNTMHRYRGTTAAIQIITPFPITKFSGWGKGQIIDLGSALAKRKDYLSKSDDFFNVINTIIHDVVAIIIAPFNAIIGEINGIISVINAICKLFGIKGVKKLNKIQNPISLANITQRLGWMEVASDSWSIPKSFIGVNIGGDWELHPQTESIMSALTILNDFHGSNLITRGNQYLLYNNNKSKFCCPDYIQIAGKNILVTPDNKSGKFYSIKWSLKKELARDIQYGIKETYLTGLTEKLIIDGTP